jgi:DNA-binding NtrC family response regulator
MDEVGDAAPELQAQLLRALESREIQVLGGSTQKVDLRIIAATEQETQGEQASLRPALFHRLAQQHIQVPPLCERLDDIGLLAEHYFAGKNHGPWSAELNDTEIAGWCQVFVALMDYSWPGNVRELFAVLGQIDLDADYPVVPDLASQPQGERASASPLITGEISDEAFLQALEACDYEAAKLAQTVPISRTSIYRRREKLGVPKASDYSAQEVQQAVTAHDGDVGAAAKALRVSKAALLRLYPEYAG